MKICIRERQKGKTTEMIRLAAERFAYIVCPNVIQARYVARMARDLKLDIPQPITWREFLAGQYSGRGVKAFIIDNLDQCVQSISSVPVIAVSLSGVAEPEDRSVE